MAAPSVRLPGIVAAPAVATGPRRAVLVLLALLLAGCERSDQAAPATVSVMGPDVLLITLDTVRRDHIGCYGRTPSVTPHIDSLCASGLRLVNAFAVAPVTLPAHASMLTGRYPPSHGARYNGETRLLDDALTLPEILRERGYRTAAFVSSFVLDRRFGLSQGFDFYDDKVTSPGAAFTGGGNERSALATTDAALGYFSQRDTVKPQFLWVHYFDAHAPYQPLPDGRAGTEQERYAGEIARVDAQVGRLLAAVRKRGRPTVIMLLADHGEGLGDHGERTHGLFVYDSTMHIPWMIAGPAVAPGELTALVSQIDLLPTLLGLLELPIPDLVEGRDVIHGDVRDWVYLETVLPYYDFALSPLHALRTLSRKYIQAPRPEYYQVDQDPQEARNLLEAPSIDAGVRDESTALAQQLDERLYDWPEVGQSTDSSISDAEAVERLRSLGYLSGSDLGVSGGDPKDAVSVVHANQDAAEAAAAGRVDEAIAILGGALAKMPDARGVLYLRARLLAQQGKVKEALRDVERLNAQVPSADSLLLQAQLLVGSGQGALAGPLLDMAAERDPNHGGILVVRGDLAAMAGNLAAARQLYQQAIAVDGARIGRQAQARLERMGQR